MTSLRILWVYQSSQQAMLFAMALRVSRGRNSNSILCDASSVVRESTTSMTSLAGARRTRSHLATFSRPTSTQIPLGLNRQLAVEEIDRSAWPQIITAQSAFSAAGGLSPLAVGTAVSSPSLRENSSKFQIFALLWASLLPTLRQPDARLLVRSLILILS